MSRNNGGPNFDRIWRFIKRGIEREDAIIRIEELVVRLHKEEVTKVVIISELVDLRLADVQPSLYLSQHFC